MHIVYDIESGHVRPRQETDTCNFGAPSRAIPCRFPNQFGYASNAGNSIDFFVVLSLSLSLEDLAASLADAKAQVCSLPSNEVAMLLLL